MSSIDYALLPSIFRKSRDFDLSIDKSVDNDRYTAYATERQILQAFISEACAYVKKDPGKNLRQWVEYAQHYGVPTRFLDWTENPLVALYFACKDHKHSYQSPDLGGADGAVWMIHLSNYRRFAHQIDGILYGADSKERLTISATIEKVYQGEERFQYPIVYKPYYTDLRMSAQASMFMVWGREKAPLDSLLNNQPMLQSNKSSDGVRRYCDQSDEIYFKFIIYKDCKQSILRELEHCGVSEKTLFPGLDGIGRYIEMKYRFDLEEAKEWL